MTKYFLSCAIFFTTVFALAQSGGFNLSPFAPPGAPADAPAVPPHAATNAEKKTEEAPKQPTEITCEKEATFEEKSHKAVFIGSVLVKDPQFTLNCDKLTAFLKQPAKTAEADPKSGAKPAAGDPKNATPPPKKTKASPTPSVRPVANKPTPAPENKSGEKNPNDLPQQGGGLDRAIAEGHVVIVQDKVDEQSGETKHYVGKALRADYDANTGDVVLSGESDPATWPQLQEGINLHVAAEPGVIMTLNRDGRLHSKGKTKTVITDTSDDKNKSDKKK